MEVKNCRGCGRLFNYISGGYFLCPACMDELDKKFMEVKKYIRENPKATIQQISDDNQVTINQIHKWVREDRLVFAEDSPIGIDCEVCGRMIKSGRFCNSCRDTMQKNFGNMYGRPEPAKPKRTEQKDKDRMRFLSK